MCGENPKDEKNNNRGEERMRVEITWPLADTDLGWQQAEELETKGSSSKLRGGF